MIVLHWAGVLLRTEPKPHAHYHQCPECHDNEPCLLVCDDEPDLGKKQMRFTVVRLAEPSTFR